MIFKTAHFRLLPDTRHRMYATVSNRLSIAHGGREYTRFVQVNTTLFSIMKTLNIDREEKITLYLDDYQKKRMVFGLLAGEDRLYDLWAYTMDRIPKSFLS